MYESRYNNVPYRPVKHKLCLYAYVKTLMQVAESSLRHKFTSACSTTKLIVTSQLLS